MSLETEITALREAVERLLVDLPAALDRLTCAVDAHRVNHLSIFERAGQEALAALPPLPGEGDTASLNRPEVPFTRRSDAPAAPVAERTPVALAEVQAVATEMVRAGERALLQDLLVNKIGVGNLAQLAPDQRVVLMDLILEAGFVPPTHVDTEAATPAATPVATPPRDEPPPAEVTAAETLTVARRLIESGRGPLVKDVLINQIRVKSLEHLTPAQRVEFVRLVNVPVQEAA